MARKLQSEKSAKKKVRRKVSRDETVVKKYEHFEEIYNCLASGWSPPTVHEYLVERWGAEGAPSIRSIWRWRKKNMPTAVVVPPQLIRDRLHGIDYKVDAIKHLSRLIVLLEERVSRGIANEDRLDGFVLPVNDTAVSSYLAAIREWWKIAQDLGLVKAPPLAPQIFDMRNQTMVLTPETLGAFRDTVREISAIQRQIIAEGVVVKGDQKAISRSLT